MINKLQGSRNIIAAIFCILSATLLISDIWMSYKRIDHYEMVPLSIFFAVMALAVTNFKTKE